MSHRHDDDDEQSDDDEKRRFGVRIQDNVSHSQVEVECKERRLVVQLSPRKERKRTKTRISSSQPGKQPLDNNPKIGQPEKQIRGNAYGP